MKKLFTGLMTLTLLLVLTACGRSIDTTKQVKEDTQTVMADIKTQRRLLNQIETSLQKSQQLYEKDRKKYPNQNLLNVKESATAKNQAARLKDYQEFQSKQSEIKTISARLSKTADQKVDGMPNQAIQNFVQSLKISQLDANNFDSYMKETAKGEKNFFAKHIDPDEKQSDRDAAVSRLNQYYGADFQQADIMRVNLNTVQVNAKQLLKKLAENSD
ncbi:hypothetical protein IV38_GL000697 [Lactobacillus selangorensis]|uniref:Lipoprotein n=1 Tax=Lactobacillus selangorensis TaxID=81857 RepID=A0A0R2FI30_9LACO|nr:hypothetical protein [Lactobacillus selangorensis]KRN27291.1 hypothetical protein IV38_GL000697 [Lactobacillus selangorensis]KRN29927.1 hypothetical protein IV40_GL000525 [Lactobacillus selangorensis]